VFGKLREILRRSKETFPTELIGSVPGGGLELPTIGQGLSAVRQCQTSMSGKSVFRITAQTFRKGQFRRGCVLQKHVFDPIHFRAAGWQANGETFPTLGTVCRYSVEPQVDPGGLSSFT
jgi:hypothetical protein